MVRTTITQGYNITIPEYLIKELNLNANETIELEINEKGRLEIIPKNSKTLRDFVGIVKDENVDALEDCKKSSIGEKIS